ncbi:MAG TPA: DUF3793 family protein [Candidatus Ruthenibacterium avium]|uniref:DUF3793 family protein n=1 Tax=Candidatus Ruthenibacterium avium TaxID=2838751 RepID=A0A9D2M1U4_9FIRM|nr:DUF3793 family protein [Candidatus Ruthenibacterium avium]
MLELYLIQHCAPTLAGVKSANLFTCPIQDAKMLQKMIDSHNQLLNPKGVHITLLRVRKSAALIYVYRPAKLAQELHRAETMHFLSRYGYGAAMDTESMLAHLTSRLQESECFPHEIGVFLSYPLEDVVGFIENCGGNCKCSGCWKVYSDEAQAKRRFEQYKKCSLIYRKRFDEGYSLHRLTVAA